SAHACLVGSLRILESVIQAAAVFLLSIQVEAMQQVRPLKIEWNPRRAGEDAAMCEARYLVAQSLDPRSSILVGHAEQDNATGDQIAASAAQNDPAIFEAIVAFAGRRVGENEIHQACQTGQGQAVGR